MSKILGNIYERFTSDKHQIIWSNIHDPLTTKKRDVYSWFTSNSEADASELLVNHERHVSSGLNGMWCSAGLNLQSHTNVLPVAKEFKRISVIFLLLDYY